MLIQPFRSATARFSRWFSFSSSYQTLRLMLRVHCVPPYYNLRHPGMYDLLAHEVESRMHLFASTSPLSEPHFRPP